MRAGLFQPAGKQLARTRRFAEVVDAEVADEGDDEVAEDNAEDDAPTSVFDGPARPQRRVWRQKYNGKWYSIFRTDPEKFKHFRYEVTEKRGGPVIEKGEWNQHFNQPIEAWKENKQEYWRLYRKKLRKLRRKHGNGQTYPNGRAIYLEKVAKHPFTKILYPEYTKPAEWRYSPKEVEIRAQRERAMELQRRLWQEREQRRLAALQELGVWPGEEIWRRPFDPTRDNNKDHRVW